MYLLIPGRHHLITEFQYKYLYRIIETGIESFKDVFGQPLNTSDELQGIVFAITSASHNGTKRNPIPFYQRALIIQELSNQLNIPCYIYGIDDVGYTPNFAKHTIKSINHQSDGIINLSPSNSVVVCSTGVMDMYIDEGFQILPAELQDKEKQVFSSDLPWDILTQIVDDQDWSKNATILDKLHSSSVKIWKQYQLDQKTRTILSDPIIGDDGDITESRDYNSYVRQMDEIADLKYQDTAPYIQGGSIGDIGCAVGSWIKLATEDARLAESDFYGIEVTRQLHDICLQRVHNNEFANPSVFFAMKNAVTGLVFQSNSMNTIHTSSLTHEIESYGSRQDLLDFIQNRYHELKPGGVWINRDVVGPENGDTEVLIWLNQHNGSNDDPLQEVSNELLPNFLNELSTYSKFIRFAQDFRKSEGYQIKFEDVEVDEKTYIKLKYKDAADFMLTKDYTDNWYSEMHETFCFWSFNDWKQELEKCGFRIKPESKDYQNPWIAQNRWDNQIEVFDLNMNKLSDTPTNMLLVAEKV